MYDHMTVSEWVCKV